MRESSEIFFSAVKKKKAVTPHEGVPEKTTYSFFSVSLSYTHDSGGPGFDPIRIRIFNFVFLPQKSDSAHRLQKVVRIGDIYFFENSIVYEQM